MMALPHEWSGSNKSVDEILQEQDAWIRGLPADEPIARMSGSHFAHMHQAWDKILYRLSSPIQDFNRIKRSDSQGQLYSSCYAHIRNEIRDPDWTSGTANQAGNNERVDPVGNIGAQGAHLLSHAAVCHRAYPFLAEAAIGISIEAMNLPGNLNTNRRKLLVGVKGGHHFTSLKGHKFNKMYWKLQGEHFDTDDPSFLVVPLLSLRQILDWATDQAHAIPYDVAIFTFGPRRQVVAQETLQYAKGHCSPEEREVARENLATFVKGIASHLITQEVFESLPDKYFTPKNPALMRWQALVNHMRGPNPDIFIPTALDGADPNILIAKARLTTGTSLPDPWLLLAKSAINYTSSNGQNVMPACPPEVSDSEDDYDYCQPTHLNDDNVKLGVDEARADFCHHALQRSGFVHESASKIDNA